jgi:ABC-type antimicrobial peptide transport system permease subunit
LSIAAYWMSSQARAYSLYRMAGATDRRLLGMVMAEVAIITAIGLAVGIGLFILWELVKPENIWIPYSMAPHEYIILAAVIEAFMLISVRFAYHKVLTGNDFVSAIHRQ